MARMTDDELDDPFNTNPMVLKTQIQRYLGDLERKGWIRRNGDFRNGQPVYVVTELGRSQGLGRLN
jgi:hypothetical protein